MRLLGIVPFLAHNKPAPGPGRPEPDRTGHHQHMPPADRTLRGSSGAGPPGPAGPHAPRTATARHQPEKSLSALFLRSKRFFLRRFVSAVLLRPSAFVSSAYRIRSPWTGKRRSAPFLRVLGSLSLFCWRHPVPTWADVAIRAEPSRYRCPSAMLRNLPENPNFCVTESHVLTAKQSFLRTFRPKNP